jgi:hypothetical protein
MDMRALKVGQKVYVHINNFNPIEATVGETTEPTFGWGGESGREVLATGMERLRVGYWRQILRRRF